MNAVFLNGSDEWPVESERPKVPKHYTMYVRT